MDTQDAHPDVKDALIKADATCRAAKKSRSMLDIAASDYDEALNTLDKRGGNQKLRSKIEGARDATSNGPTPRITSDTLHPPFGSDRHNQYRQPPNG